MQVDAFCRFFADPFPDPNSSEGVHRYEVGPRRLQVRSNRSDSMILRP
jgi:hypothetical protein